MVTRFLWVVFLMHGAAAQGVPARLQHELIDLGRQRAVGVIEQSVTFQVGAEAMTIEDVQASCGCLKPVWQKQPIPPGSTGSVKLAIHATSQRPGKKRFDLTIHARTLSGVACKLVQQVAVEFFTDLEINPTNLQIITRDGSSLTHLVTIRDARGQSLPINSVVASHPLLQVGTVSRAGNQVSFPVSLKGDIPTGSHEAVIRVTSSDPVYQSLDIPVLLVNSERVRAMPDRLSIDVPASTSGSSPKQPIKRSVILRDQLNEPIVIASMSASSSSISVSQSALSTGSLKLAISCDPDKIDQLADERIEINISSPKAMKISIPISVQARRTETRSAN